MNADKIDELIQYILSVASLNDGGETKLSMIQFIKYIYLVDLDYAARNNGMTYTGLAWKFHHYGPWNTELYKNIPNALKEINASKEFFSSSEGKDSEKWYLTDSSLFDSLGNTIGLSISGSVQKYVRMFKNDTSKLLHYVYNTKPMLNAAPEEILDFQCVVQTQIESIDLKKTQELTARQEKKRKGEVLNLKKRIKEKLEARKKKKSLYVYPQPRYDSIYFEGIKHIEEMGGASVLEGRSGVIEFDDSVWKSEMRRVSDGR